MMNTKTTTKTFSGVSSDCAVLVTIFHSEEQTTVLGTVYSEQFAIKRLNSGDAIRAAMEQECKRHPAMFNQITDAFAQAIAEMKLDESPVYPPDWACGCGSGKAMASCCGYE